MKSRARKQRFPVLSVTVAAAVAFHGFLLPSAAEDLDGVQFLRVHVPAERLGEVPMGSGRYVPMTLAEFRAALEGRMPTADQGARVSGASPERVVIADAADYSLSWTAAEGFRGSAEVTLGPDITRLRRAIPLTGQDVTQATFTSAAGTGSAEICGLPDGTVAVIAEAEGTYAWQFTLPAIAGTPFGPSFSLPLVPAVFTTVQVQLPAGYVPVVKGAQAAPLGQSSDTENPSERREEDPQAVTWQLDFGPTQQLDATIVRGPLQEVPLSCWNRIAVERQFLTLTTTIVPALPWTATQVGLEIDPRLNVLEARLSEEDGPTLLSWSLLDLEDTGGQGTGILVRLPTGVVGTRRQLVIESIAAFDVGDAMRLPVTRPSEGLWAGGGLVVSIAPRLVVRSVSPSGYLPVDETVAAGWPLWLENDAEGPRLAFEAQEPNASLELKVASRSPEVDVMRVTTVDVSAGSVMAQATSEITVTRGEIFELNGEVAAGWLIDSVEIPGRNDRPDWRVEPSAGGGTLRIGLINGVANGEKMRINIMGHRGPLREGEPFSQSSLEMLTFENEQTAALEIRTNAEMTIDGGGEPVASVPLDELPGELRGLAGDSGVRLRLYSRPRDDDRTLRLLKRRPPIDVQTQVRLTVRDDRITQSFTLECAPRDAEVDSVIVHFSEPTSDGMEWSLLPPTVGRLLARRLQPQEPGDPSQGMESWLVELVPAARGPVTLRGVQTIPFDGPLNVPLAWVEGAASPVGELEVRDAGRRRPVVINRTLSEVPGVVGDAERYATSVSRFLFDPLRDLAGSQPAARIMPGDEDGVAPRAWAWNETTTCWCHSSGVIEYETVFDIENHGRSRIVLSHPADKQIQEIRVDGVRLVSGVRETLGGETVIELPAGRRVIRLEIDALATARSLMPGWIDAWTIDPVAGVIDLPVLERLWRVGVPPDLRIAYVPSLHAQLEQPDIGWSQRLLSSTLQSSDSAAAVSSSHGFALHTFTPTSGRSTATGILLVSNTLVVAACLVVALLAAVSNWNFARRSPAIAFAVCGTAAVVALWAPHNMVAVVRAALWGGSLGFLIAMHNARALIAAAVMVVAGAASVETLAAEKTPPPSAPLKVFITGETSESTVLVPDRLFRELGRGIDAGESLGVRVDRVTVTASVPEIDIPSDRTGTAGWLLTVDLTSDSNTVCTLRQPVGGGRFQTGSLQVDGRDPSEFLSEAVSADGRLLRVPLAVPGRHRLTVEVIPSVTAAGSIGMATIAMPVAPRAALRLTESAANIESSSLLVEPERNGLPFGPVIEIPGDSGVEMFDISRADTLKLCWSVEPGTKLTRDPRLVAARNDISWGDSSCTVVASFQFDPSEGVFRSFVVAADPRLRPAMDGFDDDGEAVTIRRINDVSWLVERQQPVRGKTAVSVAFVMPLTDPVGVFRVPEVHVASSTSARSTRLVQFVTAEGYTASVRLPSGVTAVTPGELPSGSGWLAWRREVLGSENEEQQLVAVKVARESLAMRGTQRLRLDVSDESPRLRFDASIDSLDAALASLRISLPTTWEVRRLGLVRVTTPRQGALQAVAQDIHWQRTDDGTIDIVSQRPRSGRFRVDLEARPVADPFDENKFSVPWIVDLGDTPVIIEWQTDGGLQLEFDSGGATDPESSSAWQSFERRPGDSLRYRFVSSDGQLEELQGPDGNESELPGRLAGESGAGAVDLENGSPRVELTEVRFATDDRGKAWGVARIDLVPSLPIIRLQLPSGMRLFEVFVDEHPVRTRPVGEAAWELELLDVSRPRTIQVIFSGDLADSLVSGLPLRLEPPRLLGIPSRDVLWILRGPRRMNLRLLSPSLQIENDAFTSLRQQASTRMRSALRLSLGGRGVPERRRIEEQVTALFERLQESAAEQAWNRTSLALAADVYATTSTPDGGIIIRAAPKPRPADSSRAIATAVAILIAGGSWSLSMRSPGSLTGPLIRFGPFLMVGCGVLWGLVLDPAWPGWLVAALAAVVVARRLFSVRAGAAAGDTGVVIQDSLSHHAN
jgi:hypothetical protein